METHSFFRALGLGPHMSLHPDPGPEILGKLEVGQAIALWREPGSYLVLSVGSSGNPDARASSSHLRAKAGKALLIGPTQQGF